MTDLKRLRVSLTKHNAHKIALLLKSHPADELLSRLGDVHAETAQAHKNLSVDDVGRLPTVWADAKRLGPDAIDALVFVGIVFSHHQLVAAMQQAQDRKGPVGKVRRGKTLDGKAYTNFARIIDQLGFATSLEYEGTGFDLTGILELPGLGPLVRRLFELKLSAAGWKGSNSVEQECVRLRFHEVFGINATELERWLHAGARPTQADPALPPKDRRFFDSREESRKLAEFRFRAGHVEREITPIMKSASRRSKADRLHNDIQNRLYSILKAKHGARNVGTEVDTGYGTSIDVVTREAQTLSFYEIKTCESVRTSIRQALPQLLEYAHWPKEKRAARLIVVSHRPPTSDAKVYLEFLRQTYGLPLEYRQFDLGKNRLL